MSVHRINRHSTSHPVIGRLALIAALLIVSTFVFVSRPARAQTDDPNSIVIADSGFRPGANGFSFENYGNDIEPVNLTAAEMRRLFGDGVCADLDEGSEDESCLLTPAAEEYMDQANEVMGGGHCEGMAVLSLLFYVNGQSPSAFGGDDVTSLDQANELLQREIAYWFITQSTTPASEGITNGETPSAIVDMLIEAFETGYKSPDAVSYTLGIYAPGFRDGHAITPYAIIDRGDDVVWIMVYDNNYPDEERFVEVNRAENTWSYIGSTNPSEEENEYQGDAETGTLELALTAPRLGLQECSFCLDTETSDQPEQTTPTLIPTQEDESEVEAEDTDFIEVHFEGEGDLLIVGASEDDLIGYVEGEFINTFPGADFTPRKSTLTEDDPEPIYMIPAGLEFTITLTGVEDPDADEAAADETSAIVLFGPGYVLEVSEIILTPGETDLLYVSDDNVGLTYVPAGVESPWLTIGLETESDDYLFTIKGTEIEQDGLINFYIDAEAQQLVLDTTGNLEAGTYTLEFDRRGEDGESVFSAEDVPLDPDDTIYVNYATWTGENGTLELEIDAGGDGEIDETVTLSDAE